MVCSESLYIWCDDGIDTKYVNFTKKKKNKITSQKLFQSGIFIFSQSLIVLGCEKADEDYASVRRAARKVHETRSSPGAQQSGEKSVGQTNSFSDRPPYPPVGVKPLANGKQWSAGVSGFPGGVGKRSGGQDFRRALRKINLRLSSAQP